jgi:hypothetical protein
MVNATIKYLIGLNDEIDFQGAGRPEFRDEVEKATVHAKEKKRVLDDALARLPESERERGGRIVSDALAEIYYVENDIREIRDTRQVRFDEADRYRGLVNSICLSSIFGLTFGPNMLENRLLSIPSQKMSMEAIEDKYRFIREPEVDAMSGAERAIAAVYNMVQVTQINDDWLGREIDDLLRVPGYAAPALNMFEGDEKAAHRFLVTKREAYQNRANQLGLTRFAARGTELFLKSLEHGIRLGNKAHVRIGGQREKAYVSGTLNLSPQK